MMHLADYEARKTSSCLGALLLLLHQFANAELERSCNFCGHLERRERTVECHSCAGGVCHCVYLCVPVSVCVSVSFKRVPLEAWQSSSDKSMQTVRF